MVARQRLELVETTIAYTHKLAAVVPANFMPTAIACIAARKTKLD